MAQSSPHQCVGNPTFNAIYPYAFSEWPKYIPGLICKTPPVGSGSAKRFAQCCSGPVYNITAPTQPDDPAYPMSCATFCQIDPAFDANNPHNPYMWSDYFMCLTDGGQEPSEWDVGCMTNTVSGVPMPTSFSATPTGAWMTRHYALTGAEPESIIDDETSSTSLSSTTTTTTSVSSSSRAITSKRTTATSTSGASHSSVTGPTTTSTHSASTSAVSTTSSVSANEGEILKMTPLGSVLAILLAITMSVI